MKRSSCHDFLMVFVSDSKQSTLTPNPVKLTLKVPFSRSNANRNDPSAFITSALLLQRKTKHLKLKNSHISTVFRLDFTLSVSSHAKRLGVQRLVLLTPCRFHRFLGAPSIHKTPRQNAGRLETDAASPPILAFVFLQDSFLIGFYSLWKENVLQ